MASRTLNLDSGHLDVPTRAERLERVAREALSSHLGRAFSDAEWTRASKNLLEFARILGDWEKAERMNGLDT